MMKKLRALRLNQDSKLLVITVIAVGQVLAACSNRDVTITQHDAPVVGDEVVVAPKGPGVDMAALTKANPEGINARIESSQKKGLKISASEKFATLKSLETFVLNRNYLDDPRAVHTKEMRAALSAFGATLTELAEQDSAAAAPWIEKMRVAIESGCDGEMKGCTNLSFFNTDPSSARVMELSAKSLDPQIANLTAGTEKRDELVRLYYRRMGVAFALRNRIASPEFEFMYLTHAAEYAEAFGRSKQKSRERDLLAQHSEIFEMILNRLNPDLSDAAFSKKFEAFVNAFSPWNYSRRSENPFGQAATRMLSLAAKSFLYDGQTGKLSTSLQESIDRLQALPTSKPATGDAKKDDPLDSIDDSYAVIANALKNQEPEIWRNLVLSDDFAKDEYFFMIDRIYGDHLTPDDASEIWRGSRRDSKRLLAVAEQYIKVQIAGQIVRTNRYMSSIYSNKEWSSATLFQNAVEKSYPISTQWNQMLSRIDRLQLFLDRNLKSADETLSSKEFRNMNDMLISARRNIKYLSVYPNMMLMAYFMAEAQFKIKVNSFFGQFEIDSATIITWFFDGQLGPLFNFGNDGEPLKRIETLYTFLFALKTETFKAFAVSETKKLDVEHFFKVVIGKFLDADRLDLQQGLETVRKDMRQSNDMSTFLSVCRQDRELILQGVKPGQKGNTLVIDFSMLPYYTYVGSGTGPGSAAWNFHGGSTVNRVKSINESLRRKLEFVKIMSNLLEKHLEKSGVPAEVRAKTLASIESNVKYVKQLRAEYLTEVMRWNKTLSNCLDQSIQVEIDRQNDLVEAEIQHLRAVWSLMKAARQGNAKALTQANELMKSTLGLNEFNSATPYKPISQISADEYVYGEMDVVLRVRHHLKKVAPNVRILMPSDLADTTYWRERKQVAIAFNDDQNEFVREALRNFSDVGTTYIRWLGTTSDASTYTGRVQLALELYKLGSVEIYNTGHISCQGQPDITQCPMKTESISATDVVNEMWNSISSLSLTKNGKLTKDATYMIQIGSSGRWSKEKLRDFTLNKDGDPTYLMEAMFKKVSEDETVLNDAREFNRTERSVGHFLFAPEEDFKKILSQGFSPLVTNHFSRVKALENAVREREKADAKNGQVLTYSYEIRDGQIISSDVETNAGVPVYLADKTIDDASTRRMLFDRETGNAFVTKTTNDARK